MWVSFRICLSTEPRLGIPFVHSSAQSLARASRPSVIHPSTRPPGRPLACPLLRPPAAPARSSVRLPTRPSTRPLACARLFEKEREITIKLYTNDYVEHALCIVRLVLWTMNMFNGQWNMFCEHGDVKVCSSPPDRQSGRSFLQGLML